MSFINPVELLGLQQLELSSIDNVVIKKAKRRIQADIDLSEDNLFRFNGYKLTKSETERAIDELDSKEM